MQPTPASFAGSCEAIVPIGTLAAFVGAALDNQIAGLERSRLALKPGGSWSSRIVSPAFTLIATDQHQEVAEKAWRRIGRRLAAGGGWAGSALFPCG